ncbi:MAG: hypothetical protein WAK22_06540, partial [Candidatus Sulfotelmatobacter sp.]
MDLSERLLTAGVYWTASFTEWQGISSMSGEATLQRPISLTEIAPPKRVRIESIDLVRGVIMIIMALDHTREF